MGSSRACARSALSRFRQPLPLDSREGGNDESDGDCYIFNWTWRKLHKWNYGSRGGGGANFWIPAFAGMTVEQEGLAFAIFLDVVLAVPVSKFVIDWKIIAHQPYARE